MAIWRVGDNTVASDEGYKFGSASRFSFYYQEGERRMVIFNDAETIGRKVRFDSWWVVFFPFLIRFKWHIFWSDVKGWEAPYAEEKIEPQKRDLILGRIKAALKLMKMEYEIH